MFRDAKQFFFFQCLIWDSRHAAPVQLLIFGISTCSNCATVLFYVQPTQFVACTFGRDETKHKTWFLRVLIKTSRCFVANLKITHYLCYFLGTKKR